MIRLAQQDIVADCRLRLAQRGAHGGHKVPTMKEIDELVIALADEVGRLETILNTPVLEPFMQSAVGEAKHQIYRWGEVNDAKKTAWDWFWTLGYLGSKAAHAALASDWQKAKHHTVTAAAMLANWHRHICATEEAIAGHPQYAHGKTRSEQGGAP